MFTLICARINGWVNKREAGDLKRRRAHYDVIVMIAFKRKSSAQIPRDNAHAKQYYERRVTRSQTVRTADDIVPHDMSEPEMARLNDNKQRVLMHRHQGLNVRHGLCHIYMRYLYIYELFIAFVCFVVCSLL